MPCCRVRRAEQPCSVAMPRCSTHQCSFKYLTFWYCCVALGMAVSAPQMTAAMQQQPAHLHNPDTQTQQHIVGVLQAAVQLHSTQQHRSEYQLGHAAGRDVMQIQAAAKWLQQQQQQGERLQEQRQQQHLAMPSLRQLLQYKPSAREQEASQKGAGRMSGWHAFSVMLLCLLAMAVLGAIGYKAMQWYERTKRPGYVELQAMDTAYHRPWVSL